MRILTRYILREILSHAAIGAVVFTFVIFMRDIGRILELVVRNSAPLPSVVEIFAYTLPTALTITIPMGVLVGILIGLSRLAADSEITAMRTSGMSSLSFVRIISVFVLVAWALALVNNVWLAPRSAAALADLQDKLKSSQVSFEVQPRVFYEDFKNYVLYVQDASSSPEAAVWKGVFLADVSSPGAPMITLAQQGVLVNESQDRLRLHLVNGSQHETAVKDPQQYSISTFNESDIPIQVPQSENQQANALAPVTQLSTRDLLNEAGKANPVKSRALRIEFQRRLALPTACIVLALVGIPLGLSSKKGGKSTGFVLTIALVFLYYLVYLAGWSLARQGRLPPAFGLWLGNIIFLIGGILLLWRVDRLPIDIGSPKSIWSHVRKFFRERTRSMPGVIGQGDAFERAVSRRRVFSTRFPLLLDDLILRDFVVYMALIVSSFLMLLLVFTFFELIGDILRNRVPLLIVGEYLVNVTPYMLYNMAPLSVLLAVLITFGIMQKSNEITAMKATGISVYRLIVPVLVIALGIAVALFFFDQFYLPRANKRQDALRNQIKGKPPQTYLRPDRKWIFGEHNTIFYYEFFDPDQNRFGSISAFEFNPKTFDLTRRIYATRAHWSPELDRWIFEQGWERSFQGSAIRDYRTFDVATYAEINEPPAYFKKEVKQSSEMNSSELRQYINDLQKSGFDVVRLRVQLQRKFAFPLITFVMAVLAIPFALSSAGRRGALTGVAVAIGIAVVYWVTTGLFEAMGNTSQLPPALAAWSPDLIFALGGGYLILKVPT